MGAFAYNGQVCISTQRIYVHEKIASEFIDLFVKRTKELHFGSPLDDETVVTSLINKKSQSRILSWIEEAVKGGATLLTGGEAKGNGILPTVLTNVASTSSISCQEVFGPVVFINSVKDEQEAVKEMNNSDYGLNAGLFTNNLKQHCSWVTNWK
jgi:acyl-CoA reductase-like NAD-dependent aldehyde dehydrogenase